MQTQRSNTPQNRGQYTVALQDNRGAQRRGSSSDNKAFRVFMWVLGALFIFTTIALLGAVFSGKLNHIWTVIKTALVTNRLVDVITAIGGTIILGVVVGLGVYLYRIGKRGEIQERTQKLEAPQKRVSKRRVHARKRTEYSERVQRLEAPHKRKGVRSSRVKKTDQVAREKMMESRKKVRSQRIVVSHKGASGKSSRKKTRTRQKTMQAARVRTESQKRFSIKKSVQSSHIRAGKLPILPQAESLSRKTSIGEDLSFVAPPAMPPQREQKPSELPSPILDQSLIPQAASAGSNVIDELPQPDGDRQDLLAAIQDPENRKLKKASDRKLRSKPLPVSKKFSSTEPSSQAEQPDIRTLLFDRLNSRRSHTRKDTSASSDSDWD